MKNILISLGALFLIASIVYSIYSIDGNEAQTHRLNNKSDLLDSATFCYRQATDAENWRHQFLLIREFKEAKQFEKQGDSLEKRADWFKKQSDKIIIKP